MTAFCITVWCILWILRTLFVKSTFYFVHLILCFFFIVLNIVTACAGHALLKGYLLTYLLIYHSAAMAQIRRIQTDTARIDIELWRAASLHSMLSRGDESSPLLPISLCQMWEISLQCLSVNKESIIHERAKARL